MKNAIRIIGGVQIIFALVFMYYANQIDPGVAKISKRLAESCEKAEQIVNLHKVIYEKSATNIINLQNALNGAGYKTQITPEKLGNWGTWLKTPPKSKIKKMLWPEEKANALGTAIEEIGENVNDISVALYQQANILKEYEQNVLPQTRTGFDNTAHSLRETQAFLQNLELESKNNVKTVSCFAGIIFLLNAISLLIIASVIPCGRTKAS